MTLNRSGRHKKRQRNQHSPDGTCSENVTPPQKANLTQLRLIVNHFDTSGGATRGRRRVKAGCKGVANRTPAPMSPSAGRKIAPAA